MTNKMEMMFRDVMGALFTLPEDYLEFCFGECFPLSPVTFGKYVLLEFVKHAYFESMEKHPFRYFFPYSATDDDHSERMRYSRAFKYTQKYKDKNYQMLCEEKLDDPKRMEKYKPLLAKDMSDIGSRIEGYELTEMQVFEHTNIIELPIIKSIVEDRISSAKKVSNERFIEMFEEYDKWVEKLISRSNQSDEDYLFASMAFFTLEWKYDIEFIYAIADYMDKTNVEDIDYLTFWAMGLSLNFDSRIGTQIQCDNRMVKERQALIPRFFGCENPNWLRLYREKYVETVGVSCIFLNLPSTDERVLYKDWFRSETCMKDWASFMRDYNVFSVWNRKEWTNRKIKNARKMLGWVCPFRGQKI